MAISVRIFKTFQMDFMLYKEGNIPTNVSAGVQFLSLITSRINWIYIGFIPVFTFLFWIFYTRRKYNYIEHLVAGLYWNGLIVLFLALVIAPLMYVFPTLSAYYALSLIFLGSMTIYYAIGYYRMFEYRSTWKFVRSLLISFMVTIFSMAIFIVLLRIFYILNGQ
jgi:hypothetical protein